MLIAERSCHTCRNYFVEQVLSARVLRTLSVDEMSKYRRPFAEPGGRLFSQVVGGKPAASKLSLSMPQNKGVPSCRGI
jgi:hypothetical protein